jgi:hypothetical protein
MYEFDQLRVPFGVVVLVQQFEYALDTLLYEHGLEYSFEVLQRLIGSVLAGRVLFILSCALFVDGHRVAADRAVQGFVTQFHFLFAMDYLRHALLGQILFKHQQILVQRLQFANSSRLFLLHLLVAH